MKLEGLNGELFELDIIGHEYLEPDWLVVFLHVVHRTLGTWYAKSPCLHPSEVEWLAQWFEKIAEGTETEKTLDFEEPDLKFELAERGETRYIRVYFELELRPEWAKSSTASQEDIWVDLPIRKEELLHASKCLMESLLARAKIEAR